MTPPARRRAPQPRPQRVKVKLLVAEAATQGAALLNLLNAGAVVVQPVASGMPDVPLGIVPHKLAMFFEVPFELCNRDVSVVVELVDDDQHVVTIPSLLGPQPLRIEATQRFAPIPGAPNGSPGFGNAILALEGMVLPLAPGHFYKWRCTIDGKGDPQWETSFWVPPIPLPPKIGGIEV